VNREVDPFEWNNLIDDPDYAPVINYLDQWLPGAALYLKKTFKAIINNTTQSCLLANSDVIHLSFQLYDSTGNLIIAPAGYNYIWTNNLLNDTLSGASADFDMSSLSSGVFSSKQRILFYMQMIDPVTHAVVGFDSKYFYLNPVNTPSVSFETIAGDSLTVWVTNISISGTYNSVWWDWGDGTATYAKDPGPHTYASSGNYTITGYAQYGNDSACIASSQQQFTTGKSIVFER